MTGLLAVDKPVGPTSHDIVARVRRTLHLRKVGHTGTLDPLASGLLILCLGPATRLAEYLSPLPKRYRAVARLGTTTESDDREGAVVASSECWRDLAEHDVRHAFTRQQGERLQVPPTFSAKRKDGERLYRRARRGEDVTAEPVPVTIHEISVVRVDLPDVTFDVVCSAGTYIRSIARDAGADLGVGAHLAELRRTRIGEHRVDDAVRGDALDDADALRTAVRPALTAVQHLTRIELDDREAEYVRHGSALVDRHGPPGPLALVHRDRLLAIGEQIDAGIQPRKVFPGE